MTKFFPVNPQRWVVNSFEYQCGLHGVPGLHGRNIVISNLTSGVLRPNIGPAPGLVRWKGP